MGRVLSIGIVGLPNVGKSTLFNALLKKQVAYAANYPFATIDPNVGVVEVPDERLAVLAKIVHTSKLVPAAVEFYDIAGLVKGASKGEGLGNKFLSHIREVSAIVHVVRLFEDSEVIHVANKVDPLSDIQTVEQELILSDLETLSKQKPTNVGSSKAELQTASVVQRLKEQLDKGISARNVGLDDEEKLLVKHLNLLTLKPQIYVFNVSEKQLENMEDTNKKIVQLLHGSSNNFIVINAQLENDVLALSSEEQREYLSQYHLSDTGLNRLIKKSYETLGLISFLTAGELEARAWTITKGMFAPQAAGTIHTDFEKKFIKADIVTYQDFIDSNGWVKAREIGKVRSEGKDYVMQDGDVVEFKIGA